MEEKENLINYVDWRHLPVPGSGYIGETSLDIGEVGEGRPVGVVVAGIHGDEGCWGAYAINKLIDSVLVDDLLGTLRIIPVANPLAMEVDSRVSPLDHLDLNRVFPGDHDGSHTERLADLIVKEALDDAYVVLDLHGGGSWCVNAFTFVFPGSRDLAEAFEAPFLVEREEREGSLTAYSRSKGGKVVAVEMGGRSIEEEVWANRIARGLRRALGLAGVLTMPEPFNSSSLYVDTPVIIRSPRGGIFKPHLRARDVGSVVSKGKVMGSLHEPVTFRELKLFRAPFTETAMLLLRPTITCVEGGAMIYVLAPLNE